MILIVDDERLISDTLFMIFTKAGYETRAVYSADDALKVVKVKNWIPQFALLDVHLPGNDGVGLGILLRSPAPIAESSSSQVSPVRAICCSKPQVRGTISSLLPSRYTLLTSWNSPR